jgi:hypothetical protein
VKGKRKTHTSPGPRTMLPFPSRVWAVMVLQRVRTVVRSVNFMFAVLV